MQGLLQNLTRRQLEEAETLAIQRLAGEMERAWMARVWSVGRFEDIEGWAIEDVAGARWPRCSAEEDTDGIGGGISGMGSDFGGDMGLISLDQLEWVRFQHVAEDGQVIDFEMKRCDGGLWRWRAGETVWQEAGLGSVRMQFRLCHCGCGGECLPTMLRFEFTDMESRRAQQGFAIHRFW